jgi:hypothetical protein
MPSETQMQRSPLALLVGEGTDRSAALLRGAEDAGWRFHCLADIYAAAAWLLTAGPSSPDVTLVLIESLRSDELRFFDLLSRRWPRLPAVAVYAASAQDRRLDACRRRGVTVLPAQGLVEWLVARRPASRPLTEGSPSLEATPLEVELDLPDEMGETPELAEAPEEVEHREDVEAPAMDETEVGAAETDLEEAQAELAEQAEYGRSEQDEREEDSTAGLPLTPWSSQPRPQRRRVSRVPPGSARAPSATPAVPGTPAPEPGTRKPQPATPNPQPPTCPSRTRDWEHGLLTPDELRALLDDSEALGEPQENEP